MPGHPTGKCWLFVQVVMPVLCLLVGACNTSHRIDDRIFADGPRGSVSIRSVDVASLKTAHPVSVSPQLLSHILLGTQSFSGDVTTSSHIFSNEETSFLIPLISKALSTATNNQLVTFRVLRGNSSEQEVLGGTIYISGRLLHLTLTDYDTGPGRDSSGEGQDHASHQTDQLQPAQLAFIPEIDQRSSIDGLRNVVSPPPLGTLVIDYKMFEDELGLHSPVAQSQPPHRDALACSHADISPVLQDRGGTAWQETQAHSTEETQALKELVCEQAIELDALKREMHVLRHTLSEIERRKHKSREPKSFAPLQSSTRNGISTVTADPACNIIFAPLHCQSQSFLDTSQEGDT